MRFTWAITALVWANAKMMESAKWEVLVTYLSVFALTVGQENNASNQLPVSTTVNMVVLAPSVTVYPIVDVHLIMKVFDVNIPSMEMHMLVKYQSMEAV